MTLWIHTSDCAIDYSSYRRTERAAQEGSLKKLILTGLVALIGCAPAITQAQAQAEEKVLVGQVQSVDETGTEITMMDGTKLLTPPGRTLRPGALKEGTIVVAMYREEENGSKVLTKLSLKRSEPVPSTPSETPKQQ